MAVLTTAISGLQLLSITEKRTLKWSHYFSPGLLIRCFVVIECNLYSVIAMPPRSRLQLHKSDYLQDYPAITPIRQTRSLAGLRAILQAEAANSQRCTTLWGHCRAQETSRR